MKHGIETTFDSIESAHEFVGLLTEAVVEAKRDIEADVLRESGWKDPRRQEALRLALYNLEKLAIHMNKAAGSLMISVLSAGFFWRSEPLDH